MTASFVPWAGLQGSDPHGAWSGGRCSCGAEVGSRDGWVGHREQQGANDPVNHPPHYTAHPSGIECIQVTEHMNFCLGNAVKYIWRAGEKGDAVQDLEKARWYIDREIARLKKEQL